MKDPAFLFYPGDYLRDTQCLSEKVQVAYDRIICEHMRNICISQQALNFFTKKLSTDELNELLMVLEKFEGGYRVPWVVESITKRKAYGESRRKNRQGKIKEDMNIICNTYVEHMENENDNIKNKEGCGEKKEEAENLYLSIIEFFPDELKPGTAKLRGEWVDTLDKLMRIDGYAAEKIRKVIEDTRKDGFWESNFLSILKLRRRNKDNNTYFTVFMNRLNGSNRSGTERDVERVNDFWNNQI